MKKVVKKRPKKPVIPQDQRYGYHSCPRDAYNFTHELACMIHQDGKIFPCPRDCQHRGIETVSKTPKDADYMDIPWLDDDNMWPEDKNDD